MAQVKIREPEDVGKTDEQKTTAEMKNNKFKRKMMIKNVPPNEDLNEIKNIIKYCMRNSVSLQEFVSMISPYTGDNGESLREVLNDDLGIFRKLTRKVFETITQDKGDVLLNLQLQMSDFYKQNEEMIQQKTSKMINEIYEMVPNFRFEKYSSNPKTYIKNMFPKSSEDTIGGEPEEREMLRRQQAYHRLQWLRAEGERLKGENNKLIHKLETLKKCYRKQQKELLRRERLIENERQFLENTEYKKEQELELVTESLERSIIDQEEKLRLEQDKNALKPQIRHPGKGTGRDSKGGIMKKQHQWHEEATAAVEMDQWLTAIHQERNLLEKRVKRRVGDPSAKISSTGITPDSQTSDKPSEPGFFRLKEVVKKTTY